MERAEKAESSKSKGEWHRLKKQSEWEEEEKMKRSRSADKSRSKLDRDRSESERRKRERKGEELERKLARISIPEGRRDDAGHTKEKYGFPRESIIHRRQLTGEEDIRRLDPMECCLELEKRYGVTGRDSPQPYQRVDNLLQYIFPIRKDDEVLECRNRRQFYRVEFPEYGGPGKKKLYYGNEEGYKSYCGPITFSELCDRGGPYTLAWQWYGFFIVTGYPADAPGEQRKVACYIDKYRYRSVYELDTPVCRKNGPMQLMRIEEDLQPHDFVHFQYLYQRQLTPRPPGIGRGRIAKERSSQEGKTPGLSHTATSSTSQSVTSAPPPTEQEPAEEISAVSDIIWTGELRDHRDQDVIHLGEEMEIEETVVMPPPKRIILKTPGKATGEGKAVERKKISFSEEELARHHQEELERGETRFKQKQQKKQEKKQRRKEKKQEEQELYLRNVYQFRFEGKPDEEIPYSVEEYIRDPDRYDREGHERAGTEYVPLRELGRKTHREVQEAIIRTKFASLVREPPTETLEPLDVGPSASQKLEKTGETHQAYLSEMPDSERQKYEKLDFSNTEVEEQRVEFFQNSAVKADVGYGRVQYLFRCMDPRMTYQYREVKTGVIFAKPPEQGMYFQEIPELQQNVPESILAALVMTPGIEAAILQETAGYQYRLKTSEGRDPDETPMEDPYKFILSHWIHFGWMPTLPACFTVVRCRTILKNMLEDLANMVTIGDHQYFTFDSEGCCYPVVYGRK